MELWAYKSPHVQSRSHQVEKGAPTYMEMCAIGHWGNDTYPDERVEILRDILCKIPYHINTHRL